MIKRIIRWLSLQPDHNLESFYFQKNIDGDDVFYPWGSPGESYYVDPKQKAFLKFFEYCMVFLLLIPPFIAFIYFEHSMEGVFNKSSWIVVTPITIYLFIHFFATWFLIKNLKPNLLSTAGSKKFRIGKFFILLGVGQIIFGFINLPVDLSTVSIFVITLYSFLILFFWYRKGYILQKNPSSSQIDQ